MKIIEAISRFRAGGYDEQLGFTVFDTLRYRDALEPLVAEEVRILLDRLAGEVDVERALEIIAAGAEPLRDLIGAMHSKLLLAELEPPAQRRLSGPGATNGGETPISGVFRVRHVWGLRLRRICQLSGQQDRQRTWGIAVGRARPRRPALFSRIVRRALTGPVASAAAPSSPLSPPSPRPGASPPRRRSPTSPLSVRAAPVPTPAVSVPAPPATPAPAPAPAAPAAPVTAVVHAVTPAAAPAPAAPAPAPVAKPAAPRRAGAGHAQS